MTHLVRSSGIYFLNAIFLPILNRQLLHRFALTLCLRPLSRELTQGLLRCRLIRFAFIQRIRVENHGQSASARGNIVRSCP